MQDIIGKDPNMDELQAWTLTKQPDPPFVPTHPQRWMVNRTQRRTQRGKHSRSQDTKPKRGTR